MNDSRKLDLGDVRPGADRQGATRGGGGGNGNRTGREVEVYRVSVSRRVWVAFAILSVIVLLASIGMVMARGELSGVKVALQRAEARAAEADRKLQDALADKQTLMSELAVQGTLAEKSVQGEEKRAAAEKRSAALAAEVKELKGQLAQVRKGEGASDKLRTELEAVKAELGVTLVKLAEAQAELQRMRGVNQPFNNSQPFNNPPPGERDLPYGPGPQPYYPPPR